MNKILAIIISASVFLPIIIGLIVGCYRYKKYKNSIKEEIIGQYKDAQKKGGIASLYYKHPERRLFKKTFGIPILLGFLGTMLMIALISIYTSR